MFISTPVVPLPLLEMYLCKLVASPHSSLVLASGSWVLGLLLVYVSILKKLLPRHPVLDLSAVPNIS